MMEFAKEIALHIKSREPFSEPKISVYDILEHYDMAMYHNICCDRIVDQWEIDEEHIQINYLSFGDLILDYIGLMRCEDILTGYIPEKDFDQIEELFREKRHSVRDRNKMLEIMKDMDIKELRKCSKHPEKYFDKLSEEMHHIIKAEIRARKIWNRIFRKIKKTGHDIFIRIKYRHIFSLMKQCARELEIDDRKETE